MNAISGAYKAKFLPVIIAIGVMASGCSWTLPITSLWSSKDKTETTASLQPQPASIQLPNDKDAGLSQDDLALTTEALSQVLQDNQSGTSMPWENSQTGAHGTVTPLASAYTQEGLTCRDFLASHVKEDNERWIQGEACRIHQGRWQVKNLKPWSHRA